MAGDAIRFRNLLNFYSVFKLNHTGEVSLMMILREFNYIYQESINILLKLTCSAFLMPLNGNFLSGNLLFHPNFLNSKFP